MYEIKKDGKFYTVVTKSGIVQFRSLRRAFCVDWIADNSVE
jgi:hypothetical protein